MPGIVQIRYVELEEIIRIFQQMEADLKIQRQKVQRQVREVEHGGWQGKEARAFLKQMDEIVFPGMDRLAEGMGRTAETIQKIGQIFQDAEQQCSKTRQGQAASTGQLVSASKSISVSDEEEHAGLFGRILEGIETTHHLFESPHQMHSILEGIGAFKEAGEFLERGHVIKELLEWSVPEGPGLAPSVSEEGADWFLRMTQGESRLMKVLNSPVFRGVGVGLGVVDVGSNSLKLIEDLTDGDGISYKSIQTIGDLTVGTAGLAGSTVFYGTPAGWVIGAGQAGYQAGKALDHLTEKITGHAISDVGYALAEKPDYVHSRDVIDDLVSQNASPQEKAAYLDWRRDWIHQQRQMAETGIMPPRYQLPKLEVLNNVDPKLIDMAQRNVDIAQPSAVKVLESGGKLPWEATVFTNANQVPLFEQ